MDIHQAAQEISDLLYSDSQVQLPPKTIENALHSDRYTEGELDEEKCKLFVMGDENGEIPEDLKLRFKRTDALLESQF